MTQLFDHPYARFLHAVEKPNRYTGAEHGARRKPWHDVQARICLAFPDVYDIGMSHLGYRILYKILNDDPRTLAERCYAPWIDMQQQLEEHGELLLSLESARPLCDFDVVGFSLQFELTFTNILTMLDLGGIPLRSEHRSDDDPLVVAGGPVATHAEPMTPFIDAILVGDGEEALTEMAVAWTAAKAERLPRRERLERLARIPGVYVPSLYEVAEDAETGLQVVVGTTSPAAPRVVERRLLRDINAFPFPDDGPVGGPEAIFDRMSIEVARGCTEGCRFCQAGMIYRPVRERDPAQVVDTVVSALEKSGQDEVSLTALSTADVSCISPLIKTLVEKTAPERVSLSVASLRAYGLAEDLLDDMRRVRTTGLTFAPEAGTQRMRDVINKNVTEEQLMETAERVFSRGYDSMKLYFISGLPTEEDEDVLGIVDVGANALKVGKRLGKRPKVTVSVSVHVPKPHTPFQWCAMDTTDEIERKQRLLKDAVRGLKGLTLRVHDCTASVLEGVLARGDRRLGDVIERAYFSGARFDSWDDQLAIDAWNEAFEHFKIETDRYLGTLPVTARLPWDHLDIGLEDGFLAREYRKALASRLSPPCGKAAGQFVQHTNVEEATADARRLVCYDCGVACDMGKMRAKRVDFLRAMGAEEPGQRARLPVVQEEAPGTKLKGKSPERYRPPRPGSPPARWRLRFEKTGPMALLGHLDLMRELPRVIRRAGVRTAYSQGFKPKPALSFGPALSLGVASLGEYVDVKLIDAPEPDALLDRLNEAAPPGLRFSDASRLPDGTPAIGAEIRTTRYVIALARSAVGDAAAVERLALRAREVLASESLTVRRNHKGIGRHLDVRPVIVDLQLGTDESRAVVRRAGIIGDMVTIDATVKLEPNGSVRTSELVELLTGDAKFPHQVVRREVLGIEGMPIPMPRRIGAQEASATPSSATSAPAAGDLNASAAP